MNIHFTDNKLLTDLHQLSIVKIPVGAHMYGLDNSNSDFDYLIIYIEPAYNTYDFIWTHHQLQFKITDPENINSYDYNFTTLQNFIRNIISGDSTINFETLYSDVLRDSELSWLYDRKHYFRNYNIIKSYLGIAKRDLKYWRKDTHNNKIHDTKTNKKLSHFVRGIIFANNILNDNFSLDLKATHTFKEFKYDDFELVVRIKDGNIDISYDILVEKFETKMNDLRNLLNRLHDEKRIPTFMNVDQMYEISDLCKKFVRNCKIDISHIDYDKLIIDVIENGLSYQNNNDNF